VAVLSLGGMPGAQLGRPAQIATRSGPLIPPTTPNYVEMDPDNTILVVFNRKNTEPASSVNKVPVGSASAEVLNFLPVQNPCPIPG